MLWLQPDASFATSWARVNALGLPDHLHRTYELILTLADANGGQRTPPMLRHELAALRGLGMSALDKHLAALRARGLVRSDPSCNGLCLVLYPLHAADALGQGAALPAPNPTVPAHNLAVPTHNPAAPAQHPTVLAQEVTAEARDVAVPGQEPETPEQHLTTPEQHLTTPEQHLTTPERHLATPERHLATPERHLATPERHLATPERHPLYRRGKGPARSRSRSDRFSSDLDSDSESDLIRALLVEAGVFADVAERLATLPWVEPELIRYWEARLRRNRRVRSLGAVLARVLADRERCLGASGAAWEAAEDEEEMLEDEAAAAVAGDEDAAPAGERAADAGAGEPRAAPRPPPRPTPSLPFAWEALLDGLRARCGAARVDPWLAAAYPVAYQPGALTLAVGSPLAAAWVNDSLSGDLHVVVSALCRARTVVNAVVARGP